MSSNLGEDAPVITIIRPVKGLEPHLYDCIASTFHQDYAADKLCIRLCIEDKKDPAYPILQQLVQDFPSFDAQILVENEDPMLHGSDGHVDNLGPNPKIRNISRAYREAKGDIIWVIDCNVWVAAGALGRMVDKLMGYSTSGKSLSKPYKFVHHMPLVVDIVDYSGGRDSSPDTQRLLVGTAATETSTTQPLPGRRSLLERVGANGGGRLDEMFMATTHVKFYGAINTVGVAPCIVGKSNMFRKSHLDKITNPAENPILPKNDARPPGIDYFSHQICEDHLIGDLLWRSSIPGFANHGLVWGDLVIQPMEAMSVVAYAARRCRWLRARKFTVLAATLVEPGVESLLCCAYFAFSLTTLPWFHYALNIPQTWAAGTIIWISSVLAWMTLDWFTFQHLHSGKSVELDKNSPRFARGMLRKDGAAKRSFREWLFAWIGREAMALPIWTYAVLLGTTVTWRGKTFHVNMDTTVVSLDEHEAAKGENTPELERGRASNKARVD